MKKVTPNPFLLSQYDAYRFRMRHSKEQDILSFEEYINHELERRSEEQERRNAQINQPMSPAATILFSVVYLVSVIAMVYFIANGTLKSQIICFLLIMLVHYNKLKYKGK